MPSATWAEEAEPRRSCAEKYEKKRNNDLSKVHANFKHKDQPDQKYPQIIRRGAANHLLVGKDKNRGPRELLFTQKLLEDRISNNDKKVRKSS